MVVTEQTAHLESSENPEMEQDTSLCVFLFLFELYSCIFDRGAGAQPPLLGADICQPFIWSSGSEGKWPLDRWRSWTSLGSAERQKEMALQVHIYFRRALWVDMPCPALEGSLLVLLHVAHFWPWRERSRHSGDWMGLVGGGGDSNLKVCFSYFLFRACSRYYSGVEQSN